MCPVPELEQGTRVSHSPLLFIQSGFHVIGHFNRRFLEESGAVSVWRDEEGNVKFRFGSECCGVHNTAALTACS